MDLLECNIHEKDLLGWYPTWWEACSDNPLMFPTLLITVKITGDSQALHSLAHIKPKSNLLNTLLTKHEN